MKIFLGTGVFIDPSGFYWITGSSVFVGFKNLGYIRVEILNNIHALLSLTRKTIELITGFFTKKKTLPQLFQNYMFSHLSILTLSFHKAENVNKNTGLVRYLQKNITILKEKMPSVQRKPAKKFLTNSSPNYSMGVQI